MEEYQDRSLRGRVFRHLREDILNGVYKNHEELREVTIGEELGVSRTPVREALRQYSPLCISKESPARARRQTRPSPEQSFPTPIRFWKRIPR